MRFSLGWMKPIIALFFFLLAFSTTNADIVCNSWNASNGQGNLDYSDRVWGKNGVSFTLSSASKGASGSTSISYPNGRTCYVSSSDPNGRCDVSVKQGSEYHVCSSPRFGPDTTPPSCDYWRTREFAGDAWSSWDILSNSLPWRPIRGSGYGPREDVRYFQVHISDNESGVLNGQSWVSQMYDESFLNEDIPGSQSRLGDFARITVSDNAGNTRECVGGNKRIDGFAPPMALLKCSGFDNGSRVYSPGAETTCSMEDRGGPSQQFVRFRVQVYKGVESGPSMVPNGAAVSDTWIDNGTLDRIFDTDGNRITSGSAYDTSIKALSRKFTPEMDRITRITGQVCEFYGTSAERCTITNSFDVVNFLPPPPIPAVAGNGWYECGGALTWSSPSENPGVNVSSSTRCSNDGTGNDEPRSMAKLTGNVASVGTVGCYCWDNQSPTLTPITASATSWTKNTVYFTATATNDNGGSPYSGITYSCDNGATWSTGTTSTSVSFSCATNATVAQVAKVKACDYAKNCSSTVSASFFKEETRPTIANYQISGVIHNNSGSVSIGDTPSTSYTYNPNVTLKFNVSDAGGSGMKAMLFSCNPADPISASDSRWINWSTDTIKSFNVTTADGCSASEGNKTVYVWAIDNAGNISSRSQSSIVYDKTPPSFNIHDSKTILLQATNSYIYQIMNPSGGDSGIRDYSIIWSEGGVNLGETDMSTSLPLKYDFGTIAKVIPDNVSKRTAQIAVSLEDRAGNITTKIQNIDIVADGTISADHTTRQIVPSRAAASMTADRVDTYSYRMVIKDKYGNIIRPISGIREILTDWSVSNTASFIEGSRGAVWYKWDSNPYVTDLLGNTYAEVFTTLTNEKKEDGTYDLQIKSTVPTDVGYPGYTNNAIKVSRLAFKNALPSSVSDSNGCPVNYVCTGDNVNATSYDRDFGDVASLPLSSGGVITQSLSFKPVLDITLSKDFSTLTDNSWHNIAVTLKNNSVSESFGLDQYELDLRYTSDLYGFADAEIKGDFGEFSSSALESTKRISFVFSGGVLDAGSSVVRNFQIKTNTYGYGFGKFGFTSFIPYISVAGNKIGAMYPTGYNTRNLGITALLGYDSILDGSGPVLSANFGDGLSGGQKIAIQGLLANTKKGNTAGTLEDAISIDTSALNKTDFKANIRKNVESITRGLFSENGNTCEVSLSAITKDVYYYDFSRLSGASINGNNGCKLTIRGSSTAFGSKHFNILKITGKKTIIVRGGNVYIDSDLYYADSRSMLALVVLRSDADKKKGGNVLVDPDVTNIVGGAYAEGSVMSYDGTKVYDASNTNEGELTRQLLWFGSVFSSNSVGGGFKTPYECPFDSDTYQQTKQKVCSQAEATRYDFAFLRRFVLINGGSGDCLDVTKQAAKGSGASTIGFALAGKKACYQIDVSNNGLRATDKLNPIVIEYNPFIQTAGMKIFSTQ